MSSGLHPRVRAGAEGRLPEWAEAGRERRAHLVRVADLMESWARIRGEDEVEEARWRAAGYLHDALRDADPECLRGEVDPAHRHLPALLLHGPAAAARLREDGVDDEDLLRAVAYHSMGHPSFDALGRALFAADFLEPGRSFRKEWRGGLRERMPEEMDAVLLEIVRARITHHLKTGATVLEETVKLWNTLVEEGGEPSWRKASRA